MADPKALTSLFQGNKAIPSSSFHGYLFSALTIDIVFFWLPGAGSVFIGYCRLMYLVNGYKTDKMLAKSLVTALLELIPFIPAATAFVVTTYLVNKAETSKAGQAAMAVNNLRNRNKKTNAPEEMGPPTRAQHEKKTAPAPQKNTPPETNKNIDGVTRPPIAGSMANGAQNYFRNTRPEGSQPAANENTEENYREAA